MNPPIKTHGGKFYLSGMINSLLPPHIHYVEPYFGGGAVLLAHSGEGRSEVVNDLNHELTNFWTVLRNPDLYPRFQRAVEATPFSEELWRWVVEVIDKSVSLEDSIDGERVIQEWRRDSHAGQDGDKGIRHDGGDENGNGQGNQARGGVNDQWLSGCGEPGSIFFSGISSVRLAWMFFIKCRQSLAGRGKSFTPVTRTRTRRGMNNEVSAWLSVIEGLPEVHARLKRVLILNRPAVEVIRSQDGPDTVFYLDPPYLHSTRSTTSDYGNYEMTTRDHRELLAVLSVISGKFILSGYQSDIYSYYASRHGWNSISIDVPNNAAGGKSKRRMSETLWANFSISIPGSTSTSIS